jgi:hypothetical protein
VKFYQEESEQFKTQLWIKNMSPKEDGLQEYLLPVNVDMDMRFFKKAG